MATQINPYLGFNGNCREAMTFYKECLGGELTLQTFAETPIAERCPAGMENQIIHSMLTTDGTVLMATDMKGPNGFIAGTDMAISINFDNEGDINAFYSKISSEGKIIDALKEQFWGDIFGVVQDKFGKVWMLNFDKKQNN